MGARPAVVSLRQRGVAGGVPWSRVQRRHPLHAAAAWPLLTGCPAGEDRQGSLRLPGASASMALTALAVPLPASLPDYDERTNTLASAAEGISVGTASPSLVRLPPTPDVPCRPFARVSHSVPSVVVLQPPQPSQPSKAKARSGMSRCLLKPAGVILHVAAAQLSYGGTRQVRPATASRLGPASARHGSAHWIAPWDCMIHSTFTLYTHEANDK